MSLSTSSSRSCAAAFLTVFLVGTVVFVAGSEGIVRRAVAPQDGIDRYRTRLHTVRASVAAFGDSHVANAIEDSGRIANLGYPGMTLPLMLAAVRAYVASNGGRKIVVQLSPQQFASYRAERDERAMIEEITGRLQPMLQFLRPQFRRYLLSYWRATLQNPGMLLRRSQVTAEAQRSQSGTAQTASPRPASFADLSPQQQMWSAGIRAQLHAPLPQGPAIDRLLDQLSAALAEVRGANIEVCLVRYPVSVAYRRAAAAIPSFASLQSRVKRLAAEAGVHYVDLTDAIADELFANADHVAPQGQPLVTKLVADRCFGTEPTASAFPSGQ